jgi:hypothetical protein
MGAHPGLPTTTSWQADLDAVVERVTDQCSWFALHSDRAIAWVQAHVPKPGFWGGRLLVWNHEVPGLVAGMEHDGLRLEFKDDPAFPPPSRRA